MSPIRKLPPTVINRIAAGEVLERPGSAVKEMVENSIDAGATAITVEIVDGGRELIRVVDDGKGIPAAELPLAVASHATSKLDTEEDLFRIKTFGFRGEALSSIAAVSDFRLCSRPLDAPVGAALEVHHGALGEVVDVAIPPGTQIEARNLFASVPVRRKFLKSKQTEMGHVTEALIRLALANPAIALELIHNDRTVHKRPGGLGLAESIGHFFGRELEEALIRVESETDGVRVHGFAADPRVHRPNSLMQYLFVNGRFIRDRSLGHAITEAYRGLVMTGRYPIVFLFIELPRDQVDVNVHPTKIEVRFQDPHRIYSQILSTLRTRFLSADLTARLEVPAASQVASGPEPTPVSAGISAEQEESAAWSAPEETGDERRTTINEQFTLAPGAREAQPSLWPTAWTSSPAPAIESFARRLPHASIDEPPLEETGETPATNPARTVTSTPGARGPAGPPGKALQLHNAYLVVETPEGMLLVDQHALHERILYEHLRARVAAGEVEVQELLVPEPVTLSAIQAGLVLENRDVLAELGLKVEEFGDRCVLVRGYPGILRRFRPEEMLRELANRLEETGRPPSRDLLLEDLLHMMACKAAVKAGDRLTEAEIQHLVSLRHLVDDVHHCPHGRPTILRFTLADLERQFKRT